MNMFDHLTTSAQDKNWADANCTIADMMLLAKIWFRENEIECSPDHLLKYAELVIQYQLATAPGS